MKFLILLLTLSCFCGCYNPKVLDRTPVPRKKHVKKVQPQKKRQNSSGNPLFDAAFKRKPQNFDDSSILSERELELMKQNNISNDPMVREMHNRGKNTGNKQSDWVFGTKNGSYF